MHLGGTFGYQGSWCHSLTCYYVNVDEWFDTKPEWFSYRHSINGRLRHQTQLCLTNPEVLAQVIKEVRAECEKGLIAFGGERFIISITQADYYNFCQCPACEERDALEESHAGTNIHFVNAVADAIRDEFPMVLIDTFAYQYTRKPPKYVRPRDNVLVRFAPIETCYAHPLNDPKCDVNRIFADDLRKWSEIASHLYIWDYSTNFNHYNAPFPNFQVLQADMQFFVEHNVKGVYSQGNHEARFSDSEFAALRGYIMARLMFDPYMDFELEMGLFMRAWYGEGWQYIRENKYALV
jgi:hypothetical protein